MYENDGSLFKADGAVLTTLTVDCAARVIDTAIRVGYAEVREGGVWLDDRAALVVAEGVDQNGQAAYDLLELQEEHGGVLDRYRATSSELQEAKGRLRRLREVAGHSDIPDADKLAALLQMLEPS